METVGSRIREERERVRISQGALIARLGIAKSTQINYESDRRAPDALYLAALADAGMDVAYIVSGCRFGAATSEELELLARFRSAPDAIRAGVTALLSTVQITPSSYGITPPAPASSGTRSIVFQDQASAAQVVNGDQHVGGDQVIGSPSQPARSRAKRGD